MSSSDPKQLRNAAAFPSAIAHLNRAGSIGQQIALLERAWAMLEVWSLNVDAPVSRLSNAWLGEQDWRIQIAPQRAMWEPESVAALAAFAARHGHTELLGTSAEPSARRNTAVWRVPSNAEDISRFFESHFWEFSILFPADLSFAIHCTDGDFGTYAGPESFLREALPPEAIGPRATAAAIAYVNPELTEADWEDFLGPYRPFMIG